MDSSFLKKIREIFVSREVPCKKVCFPFKTWGQQTKIHGNMDSASGQQMILGNEG